MASAPTSSTPVPTPSARASARRSSRRSRTCSWSATTTSSTGPSASTRGGATRPSAASGSTTSSRGSRSRSTTASTPDAMTLDRLWAGWRATYINDVATQRPAEDDDGCLFERLAAADPNDALVLARTDRAFAVMNAYPYTSGHLMVAPVRHVATLAALDRDDAH